MKRRGESGIGLGAASLMMILLVLCLSLMGVLSLMSARADLSLSRRQAELAAQYAQASAKAQEALSMLDAQLADAHQSTEDENTYAQHCEEIVLAGEAQVNWETEIKASLTVDAGEARTLLVEIERESWEKAEKNRYHVTGYRLNDGNEWIQTESLILMDMD